MAIIALTQGQVAIVDDDDVVLVASMKWCAHWSNEISGYYAVSNQRKSDGPQKTIRMHRLITGAGPGVHVDHINHNTLDNRRANLRVCSPSQNHMNRRKRPGTTSNFKGVYWSTKHCRWMSVIHVMDPTLRKSKRIYLGMFHKESAAAQAYNAAAISYFGNFALTNNIGE